MFRVSFTEHNVWIGDARPLFPRAHLDRFEWIALLAYRRATSPSGGEWVSRDDIARLPKWMGKSAKHIGQNVARYLQSLKCSEGELVEARSPWAGPYRLTTPAVDISFDLPLEQVTNALRLVSLPPEVKREHLSQFVHRFVRAELLFQRGRLISTSESGPVHSAHRMFTDLARDYDLNSRLQLIATLSAIRVQFRIGRFGAARRTLCQIEELVKQVADPVLEAQYFLALAWSHRRAESGTESNRTVEVFLSKARKSASDSGDRSCLGALAYREAWSLARKRRYDGSLARMSFAVEAAIITSNFTALQTYCIDLGSIVHRIGPRHYAEARRWILTGILIARWTGIGRDDAHGEMILGKMYSERPKKKYLAALWLDRAERIAQAADNAVNLADVRMGWAFWHRQHGKSADLIETLGSAVIEFRRLPHFDSRQKERYMMHKFPSVWPKVLAFVKEHQ